ncbi:acyl-lipid (9-3)-desaturase-like [Olea europaea subsp. europaea]|uniref:Acyl-lipid (9-3)-desaturase-like n=1 Tax=Olea europaea subsp. europaea TaxID=158383 RepID=A0A8S0QJM7_OLEEU|nr:acyl-lipid (9-3)-desaturase-like [Olea europaea subsp. europaea]
MSEPKRYITSEELKKHKKPGDLWISIQGKVYDVSEWVNHHPGGEHPLLNLAGQDATDAFVAFHPGTAWQYLDKFFNGFYFEDYSVSDASKDYRKLVYEFSKMGLFDKKGISIEWWKWNHNSHHIACNSLDYDPDLQHLPFFAVSSKLFSSITSYFYDRKLNFDSFARFLVSNQHFTFYPVMCFARINLWAQSFILLFSDRKVPNRIQEIFGLLVFWIWYPLLVSCLPSWSERLMFVIASFTVCGIQHVQFCLNHFSSSVYFGPPKGNDWFEKQTNGTLGIKCSSWMDWFHGGLQFQVEHHLFPRLPRCHLRKISPFVKELCKKHGLPYNCASFWEANVMTVATLKNAAMQARDFTKPVPRNLVWEAVNTHG